MLRRFGPHSSRWIFVIFTLIINLIAISGARKFQISRKQPNQVHLSYGATETERVVTWVTLDKTKESAVKYGVSTRVAKASGYASSFVDGGPKKRSMYIHRVVIRGLTHGVTYRYRCGSAEGWSPEFTFKVARVGDALTLAVYGDLGTVNAQSLPTLRSETQGGQLDAVLHLGDFAYDLNSKDGYVGDAFMRQIEPISAYVPYMTAVGNHERKYNYSHYASRFTMLQLSGKINNFFYSFNLGPAHIISFASDYYLRSSKYAQVRNQFHWLERDLQEANLPENRNMRPWIITMSHHPMYCSNKGERDCNLIDSLVRTGLGNKKKYALEKLFRKYGVDLQFTGHQHSYERTWPIFNYTVYDNGCLEWYRNPKAPVHIVSGAAGNDEKLKKFPSYQPPWSAVRMAEYGFCKLRLLNRTHLNLEYITTSQAPEVVDHLTIEKDDPYPFFSKYRMKEIS